MKADELLDAIGEIDGDLIACGRTKKKRRAWKWLSMAACLALVLGLGTQLFLEAGFWRSGCSAFTGTLVDGIYYYSDDHNIYAYTPGQEPEKKMSGLFIRDWYVNEYGIYYVRRKSAYVLPHHEKKGKRLYTALNCTHILSEDYGGDVIVSIFDRRQKKKRQMLIDGRTGAALGEVQPEISFDQSYETGVFSNLHAAVGQRKLELIRLPEAGTSVYDIRENGVSLLPEGMVSERTSPQKVSQDALLFDLLPEGDSTVYDEGDMRPYLLVTADGRTETVTLPFSVYSLGKDGWFYFVPTGTAEVVCVSSETGEQRTLETDGKTQVDFYEIETDGELLYACAPWDTRHESWRVEHDETGAPVGLTLLDDDLTE